MKVIRTRIDKCACYMDTHRGQQLPHWSAFAPVPKPAYIEIVAARETADGDEAHHDRRDVDETKFAAAPGVVRTARAAPRIHTHRVLRTMRVVAGGDAADRERLRRRRRLALHYKGHALADAGRDDGRDHRSGLGGVGDVDLLARDHARRNRH